jgi:hypothetical protein
MADPMRQKFYDMRALAAGNPYAMKDPSLFYKQAKFMEDFADDFDESEVLSMYYPCYQLMGYRQLRTYFTWRAQARRGVTPPTSLSYVFLYVYELLSNVGAKDPADGLDKLMAVWGACREAEPSLDSYLPRWLKDYHVYYSPLPHNFADFVGKHALWKFYPELLAEDAGAEGSLAAWNRISSYDVTKSGFYNAGHAELYRDCFYAALSGIRELFAERNTRFENIFMYNAAYPMMPWNPFPRALFHPWLPQPDRQVAMPGRETYTCKGGRWTTSVSMRYAGQKEVAGYLMKKIEACLRQALGYKYKLAADPSAAFVSLRKLKWLDVTLADMDAVVERAVADFHRDLTRTVVAVDHGNLARIREEALGTQHRLTVADAEAQPADDLPATVPKQAAGESLPQATDVAPMAATGALLGDMLAQPPQQTLPPTPQALSPPPALASDGWAALGDALSAVERQALAIALRDSGGVKAFADSHGLMPEILADGINGKAADYIGDNLLDADGGADGGMAIYDDYKENVAEMVGSA